MQSGWCKRAAQQPVVLPPHARSHACSHHEKRCLGGTGYKAQGPYHPHLSWWSHSVQKLKAWLGYPSRGTIASRMTTATTSTKPTLRTGTSGVNTRTARPARTARMREQGIQWLSEGPAISSKHPQFQDNQSGNQRDPLSFASRQCRPGARRLE